MFHTTRRDIDAFGRYDSGAGKFVVLASSQADMGCRCGTKDKLVKRLEDLRSVPKDEGSIAKDAAGVWRVNCDVELSTPSAAAVFVLGGSQNSWTEWVSDAGETLSAVYRGR